MNNFMFFSPLEQFEIVPYDNSFFIFLTYIFTLLNYYKIYFNDYTFFFKETYFYTFGVFLGLRFLFATYNYNYRGKIFPRNFLNYMLEKFFFILYTSISEQIMQNDKKLHVPIFFSLFITIAFANIMGLTPYSYTITSLVWQNLIINFCFLFSITLKGFFKNGPEMFHLVIPTGVPKVLVPFLTVIEILSYVARAFSLGIRLFANMMAGHTLMVILAGFSFKLTSNAKYGFIAGVFPFIAVLFMAFLEVGICILQGYVFMILLCIYLNEAYNPNSHGPSGDHHNVYDWKGSHKLGKNYPHRYYKEEKKFYYNED